MIGHVIDIEKVKLVKAPFERTFGDKVTVFEIQTSKKSLHAVWQLDQTVMIDGAEEYRAEPGSVRNAGDQTNTFPVDGGWRS